MNKIIVFFMILFVCLLSMEENLYSVEEQADIIENIPDGEKISLNDTILYGLRHSYEVRLAKLDLYISETNVMFSEAVFDTFFYGGANYREDKSQQLSVFAADDNQTNNYFIGIQKNLPTGTKVDARISDIRTWSNTPFISKNPAHDTEALIEIEQPVARNIFGYVDRANSTIARLGVKNADLLLRDSIEELIAQLEIAYWVVIFRKMLVEINIDVVEKAVKLNEVNERKYGLGMIERGDLYASKANLIRRKTELAIAENSYKNSLSELKMIMNAPEGNNFYPDDKFGARENRYDLIECLKTAFAKRRDIKILRRDAEIMNITLKTKNNMMLPEIDLKMSFAVNGLEAGFTKSIDKTTGGENTDIYVGIDVSVPLENNQARSEHDKAEYEKEQTLLNLKKTERAVITEVTNSYRNVNTFSVNSLNAALAVKLQDNKLQEEIKRFKQGRSTTKTLIDYQQDLLRARREEALVLLDLERSRTELKRSMNVLLDKYEGSI